MDNENSVYYQDELREIIDDYSYNRIVAFLRKDGLTDKSYHVYGYLNFDTLFCENFEGYKVYFISLEEGLDHRFRGRLAAIIMGTRAKPVTPKIKKKFRYLLELGAIKW